MFFDRIAISEISQKISGFFRKTKKLETENRIFLSIEKRKLSLISDLLLKKMVI